MKIVEPCQENGMPVPRPLASEIIKEINWVFERYPVLNRGTDSEVEVRSRVDPDDRLRLIEVAPQISGIDPYIPNPHRILNGQLVYGGNPFTFIASDGPTVKLYKHPFSKQ